MASQLSPAKNGSAPKKAPAIGKKEEQNAMVINVFAVLSFLELQVSSAVVAYVYLNREAIAENVKEKVTKAATEAIAGALPGMLDAATPKLPEATGGALPMPGL